MFAIYKCLKCGKEWEHIIAPTQCPQCGHLYVKWVNYEQLRKIWDDREKNKNKV
jgi:predicted  nucleic acid-binding Zn-ribbon protein